MFNSSSSYRPDESNADIFSEHTWLQGAFLATLAYGAAAVLYFMTVSLLLASKGRILLSYISMMFLLSTLYIAGELKFTQQAFIDDRNIPGGPSAYENVMYNLPIDMLSNVTLVLLAGMCDIINVWRCSIIYRGSRVPWYYVIALPMIMYIASLVLGILWLKEVSSPGSSPYDAMGTNWTIPYLTMSLALNIIVTLLIVGRLLVCRARINRALGRSHGAHYTSLAAMIVESAAMYSAFALLFLVPFSLATTTSTAISQMFLQALSPMQVLSTLLIIFRIAQGKSWSERTAFTISEVHFNNTELETTSRSREATPAIGGPTRASVRIETRRTGVDEDDDDERDHGGGKDSDRVTLDTVSEYNVYDCPKPARLDLGLRLPGSQNVPPA
ncbi:hypothetical protein HMN09_01306200 [Mycena chlorophos]|uniref:Uncharacterized protein n=1 Tax=Mycena chlorophos TaxID=658473 RepID=A0A8H6RZ66_MYCCL|nr:hypothetical protein HMN09_01306200 [Mycena chlorophos]